MRWIYLASLLAFLAACAAPPRFTQPKDAQSAAFEERIAADTVKQIARLFPPAKTQLNVVSAAPGSFGPLLADRLRGQGFGVSETIEAKPRAFPFSFNDEFRPGSGTPGPGSVPVAAAPGIELRYLLDPPHAGSISRITIRIGGAVLARAYLTDSHNPGAAAPAGAWTYRGDK